MLWVFLALCLALNGMIVFGSRSGSDFVRYVSDTSNKIGYRCGSAFDKALAALPETVYRNALISQTVGVTDTYEKLDVTDYARAYIDRMQLQGLPAAMMKEKYNKLQHVVDSLAETDASLDLYAAGATYDLHQLLFGDVLKTVTTEACLFAVIAMLCILGFEFQAGTELTVYSTKLGRRMTKVKVVAGLTFGVCGFVVIAGLTLLLYFSVWDYSGIWSSSVSSQFNYIYDAGEQKPIITWYPFTVGGYLGTVVALDAVLVAVFALAAAVIGLRLRNTYIAFLVFLVLALGMMALTWALADLKLWMGFFISMLLPVPLWLISPIWLTDLGSNVILPYHETIGLILNLIIGSGLTILAARLFRRKDLT
jgi:hypothetical protein